MRSAKFKLNRMLRSRSRKSSRRNARTGLKKSVVIRRSLCDRPNKRGVTRSVGL